MQLTHYLSDGDAVESALADLRRYAAGLGIDPVARARMVVEVGDAVRAVVAGRQTVRVGTDTWHRHLVVTVEPAGSRDEGARREWRLPLPSHDGAGPPPPGAGPALVVEELRATLARIDGAEEELRRLKEELAETNQGILALVVELEEQDAKLRRAHRALFRELEDALRPPVPRLPGLDLALHYAPAGDDAPTGGDLYDFLVLPGGQVQVVVVDVAGHGVAGTRDALNIIYTIRALTLQGYPPETLVGRTAQILEPAFPDLVGTVLLARLDLSSGRLEVATGSHPPPLIVTPGGQAGYAQVMGCGLGYPRPGSDVVDVRRLEPGTLVLLYTDGLVEAERDLHAGMEQLAALGAAHHREGAGDLTQAVVSAMHRRILHGDDTLLIALRWTP